MPGLSRHAGRDLPCAREARKATREHSTPELDAFGASQATESCKQREQQRRAPARPAAGIGQTRSRQTAPHRPIRIAPVADSGAHKDVSGWGALPTQPAGVCGLTRRQFGDRIAANAIARLGWPSRFGSWHCSDAVTRDRAIAFTRQTSGRWRVRDRSACWLPVSTASSRDYHWSPKRKQARRRRKHKCDRVSHEELGAPDWPNGAPPCQPVDDSPGRKAVAWDRRRAPPDYAWSGSAGVDAVVTALVLIGHLVCDAVG